MQHDGEVRYPHEGGQSPVCGAGVHYAGVADRGPAPASGALDSVGRRAGPRTDLPSCGQVGQLQIVQRLRIEQSPLPVGGVRYHRGDLVHALRYLRLRVHLPDGVAVGLGVPERVVPGYHRYHRDPGRGGEPPHALLLAVDSAGVEDHAEDAGLPGVEVGQSFHDVVGRVHRHELPGGDEYHRVRVFPPQRDREPSADHVAEHVVDLHVDVHRVRPELLEGVEGRQDPTSSASYPRLGPSGLGADNSPGARLDDVLQLPAENRGGANVVQDGGLGPSAQKEAGGVVLGVASDLHDLLAAAREGERDVGGHGRFADAALAVDSDLEHMMHFGLSIHDCRLTFRACCTDNTGPPIILTSRAHIANRVIEARAFP